MIIGLISVAVKANDRLKEIDASLGNIISEQDRGRFEFAYNSWLVGAKDVLASAQIAELGAWKPENMQTIWLPDSAMQVLYFVKRWELAEFEIKWLIRSREDDGWVVSDFTNEFKVPLVRKMAADTIFEFTSSFYDSGSTTFESLALQGVNSGKSYFSCVDLKIMTLFERLHQRNLVDDRDKLLSLLDERLSVLWSDNELFTANWGCFSRMKTLTTQDGNIKICTYLVPTEGFSSFVKGAVIQNINNRLNVIKLNDRTDEIRTPERSKVSADKWYGALYTDLVEIRSKKLVTYTLLGFKGNDGMVKTRVIDVMTISGRKVYFGASIFKHDRKTLFRHIFRYSAGANMMLRYDEKLKMIVFDHLSPSDPIFNGQYRFYGPDFSYDGYRYDKGNWIFVQELDLRNPKTK